MWKRIYLLTLALALSKATASKTNQLIAALEKNLNYVQQHYKKINVDCLFGVVLSGAILEDTLVHSNKFKQKLIHLKLKTDEIYKMTSPVLAKTEPNWHFLRHIALPGLWSKQMEYKSGGFHPTPVEGMVERLFSNEKFNEGFSDHCLASVVNQTLQLRHKKCKIDENCERFIAENQGAGYITTHKLLLLQVSRARNCKINPRMVEKLCSNIYRELISVEYFVGLDDVFDLFLEQCLLCGYEGFKDFLAMPWLDFVLDLQHSSGCFPAGFGKRRKRDTNLWKDGCTDHSTGLGAAVLSLYLNYVIKNPI